HHDVMSAGVLTKARCQLGASRTAVRERLIHKHLQRRVFKVQQACLWRWPCTPRRPERTYGIVVPCNDDIRAAADVPNVGKKSLILAGQGALGAGTELEQLADVIAAQIVKPL